MHQGGMDLLEDRDTYRPLTSDSDKSKVINILRTIKAEGVLGKIT